MALTSDILSHLACPVCGFCLTSRGSDLVCDNCVKVYKVFGDIPDLRYCTGALSPLFAEDERRAEELRRRSAHLSHQDMVRLCYQLPASRTAQSVETSVDYMLRGRERMKDLVAAFSEAVEAKGWAIRADGLALDLGCGCATTTGYLTERFSLVFGVNPAKDELVVAERVNRTCFANRMVLVCAFGEHLPFQDETFDFVLASDVIEHVVDPQALLLEAERVLKPGGIFCLTSPNQFNLISPEGHVKVRFVGLVPTPLRETYVRWRTGGASWVMRNVRPLSYGSLRKSLRRLRQSDFDIVMYRPGPHKPRTWLARVARCFPRLARWFLVHFSGQHEVIIRKRNAV